MAIAAYAAAVLLFLLSRDPDRFINSVAVLSVAAAVLFVTQSVRTRLAGDERRGDRITIMVALAVIGVLLLTYWQIADHPDGFGFAGLASIYLAFGLVVAECRRATWNGVVGTAILGACAVATLVGIMGLAPGEPTWALVCLVGGLLLAPVGLNMLSGALNHEHEDATAPPEPSATWLIAGLALFGGSLVLMYVLTVPLGWVLVIGGLVFGLMLAIAMPASLDVVVVVGVIAAVALTSQQEVNPPSHVQRRIGVPAFAALGDSFISGEGAQEFLTGTNSKGHNECRRSPQAYASLLAEDPPPGVPGQVIFLACSGAKAINIATTNQYPDEPTYHVKVPRGHAHVKGQLGVLEAIRDQSARPDDIKFVLLSVGGNDSLFGTIAQTCMLPGDCSQLGQAWLNHLDRVEQHLEDLYRLVNRRLHGIPVLVMPYPVPVAADTCDYSLFTQREHEFLNGFTKELNRAVHRAANAVGFRYVDTVPAALEHHRICDGPRNAMAVNFLRFNGVTGPFEDRINPKNWLHNNLHPNEEGHRLIRDALVAWLAKHPLNDARIPTAKDSGSVPDVTSIVAGQTGDVCVKADSDHIEQCSTDWALDRTTGMVLSRGLIVVAALGGAWLLALFSVGWYRKRAFNASDPPPMVNAGQ